MTKLTQEEIKNYAEANHCTLMQARDRLKLLRSTTERSLWIKNYCAKTSKSLAAGAYAYQQLKNNKKFDGFRFLRGRNNVKLTDLADFTFEFDKTVDCGVRVFYKNKEVKTHKINRWFYVYNRNTNRQVAVATLVYVLYYREDIPLNYVVDHRNNRAEDNSIENLQLLSWSANVRKNSVGHNQYTKK